jgi:hypothetical protein
VRLASPPPAKTTEKDREKGYQTNNNTKAATKTKAKQGNKAN